MIEPYINTFEKKGNRVIRQIYNSDKIKYRIEYYLGTSSSYSDHTSLCMEHIRDDRDIVKGSINLWRESDYIGDDEKKVLKMLRSK